MTSSMPSRRSEPPPGAAASPRSVLEGEFAGQGMQLVLHALQSPINIGMILRTAEAYEFGVAIYDRHSVLANQEKLGTIRDFACGALTRRSFQPLADAAALEELRRGRRLIATSIEEGAKSLSEFEFEPRDLVMLGNEYDGLPADVIGQADALLWVPMPPVWMPKEASSSPIDKNRTTPVARDGRASLNVATTAGILCHAAYSNWLRRRDA